MNVSIITTTYNEKDFLKDCIESVKFSKFGPLDDLKVEHIIYDDASTDGTEELLSNYPNIKYIKGEKNKGPSFGRNEAIKNASGEYIFVLDADDILLQRTIYNFMASTLENPNTDWFISGFLKVDKDLKYLIGKDYYGWKFDSIEEMLAAIYQGGHFIQHNVLFRKNLFDKVGGYNTEVRMSEDLDLFVRFLINKSKPLVLDFISHLHRIHDNNLSKDSDKESQSEDIQSIYERYNNK